MRKMHWHHHVSNLIAGGMVAVGGLLADIPQPEISQGGLVLIGSGILTFMGTLATLVFRDRRERREERRMREERIAHLDDMKRRLDAYESLTTKFKSSIVRSDANTAKIAGIKGDLDAAQEILRTAGFILPIIDTPSVLLVEDSPEIAQAMVKALKLEGFIVEHATTLKEALSDWQAMSPDWVLLDLMLPDGDGEDFLRQVRATQSRTSVGIITGVEDAMREERVKLLQPDLFLKKPIDFSRLVQTMRVSTSTDDFPAFKNPELVNPPPIAPPPNKTS